MKRTGKHIWFFCTLICVFSFNTAVAQKIWSEVSVNRSSVVVGQPVEVSVSLYTSTWFTTGINPGNIQVNGAFTVYFRAVSNVKKIDQKTYAGVTLIFNVFPYEDGEMIFPALTLDVESPKEGDFKGIARKINTKEKAINVKPIPPGYNPEEWLVTSNLSVRESWSGNRTQVKVGDVLVRTINRTATGTVAELIPPIIWDTLSNVGLYPGNSNFENLKTKTSINSTRSESVQYLFEREGEVVLPEMEITWWNPYKNKLYKRTLAEVKIDVLPNPDLGILASIKDSLALLNTPEELPEESKTPFLILGYTFKEFLSRVLIAFIIVHALHTNDINFTIIVSHLNYLVI